MDQNLSVLLVHNREESDFFRSLEDILFKQGIQTSHAASCSEARRSLRGQHPPELVFAEVALPDGSWSDVLELANESRRSARVIVVSPQADMKVYLEVLESSASDFIVPPFRAADVEHVVQVALHQRPRLAARMAAGR